MCLVQSGGKTHTVMSDLSTCHGHDCQTSSNRVRDSLYAPKSSIHPFASATPSSPALSRSMLPQLRRVLGVFLLPLPSLEQPRPPPVSLLLQSGGIFVEIYRRCAGKENVPLTAWFAALLNAPSASASNVVGVCGSRDEPSAVFFTIAVRGELNSSRALADRVYTREYVYFCIFPKEELFCAPKP